jgi:steroid delta-isomerase-like uncharacterized protein
MKAEENLNLIRKRYEAVNAHDWDRFQQCYAEEIVWRDPGLPSAITGPPAVRKRLEALSTAFPDLHWKLDRIFGQDDLVCAEFTFTGTHKGTFHDHHTNKPIIATNKNIDIKACGVYRVWEGKIIDSVIYFDYRILVS